MTEDDRAEFEAARSAGLKARHETRVERAIRRQVAEEIARALDAMALAHDQHAADHTKPGEKSRIDHVSAATGLYAAARVARGIGTRETS